jgi:hypothetical protein
MPEVIKAASCGSIIKKPRFEFLEEKKSNNNYNNKIPFNTILHPQGGYWHPEVQEEQVEQH